MYILYKLYLFSFLYEVLYFSVLYQLAMAISLIIDSSFV